MGAKVIQPHLDGRHAPPNRQFTVTQRAPEAGNRIAPGPPPPAFAARAPALQAKAIPGRLALVGPIASVVQRTPGQPIQRAAASSTKAAKSAANKAAYLATLALAGGGGGGAGAAVAAAAPVPAGPTATLSGGGISGLTAGPAPKKGPVVLTEGGHTYTASGGGRCAEPVACAAYIEEHEKLNAAVKNSPASWVKLADKTLHSNAWPCQSCDDLLLKTARSCKNTITLVVESDKSLYGRVHGVTDGNIGTITYE